MNPLAELLLIFERHGRERDREVARDADRASQMLALMVARHAPAEIGDTYSVEEA